MVQLGELVWEDGTDIVRDLYHEELELNGVTRAESINRDNSGKKGDEHGGSSGENKINTTESFHFFAK